MTLALPSEKTFRPGDPVIEQGEPAMEAYLILEGSAEARLINGDGAVPLGILREGDIFGEAALFKGSDYGASVFALTPLTVQPIPPPVLDEKISRCDPMIRALIRMLMIRLRQTNMSLAGLRGAAESD